MQDPSNLLSTTLTAIAAILSIEWFSSLDEIESIYSMFVQSLVATAAIGKILWEVITIRKKRGYKKR